jgi:hypothetical protein
MTQVLIFQYCACFFLTVITNLIFKISTLRKQVRRSSFLVLINHIILLDIFCSLTLMPVNFCFQTRLIKYDLVCKLHPFLILFIRTFACQLTTLIAFEHLISSSLEGRAEQFRVNLWILISFSLSLTLALTGFFSIGISKKGIKKYVYKIQQKSIIQ